MVPVLAFGDCERLGLPGVAAVRSLPDHLPESGVAVLSSSSSSLYEATRGGAGASSSESSARGHLVPAPEVRVEGAAFVGLRRF